MVKVFQGTDKEYYLDGYLQKNLDLAKSVIDEDWDMVFVVDGNEGGGKSSLAIQCAYYLDPTLSLDRVTFTPEEFTSAIRKANKKQAVIFDEAFCGLSSRATMSSVNRTIVRLLTEIRQKNLFVFIVLPTFFDLDKYVALWRSRALLHVYVKNFKRGQFEFYSSEKKKNMYVHGKKLYKYGYPCPDFRGAFTKAMPLDDAAYREKKLKSMEASAEGTSEIREREIRDRLFECVQRFHDVYPRDRKHAYWMELLGMRKSSYFDKLSRWRVKNMKKRLRVQSPEDI